MGGERSSSTRMRCAGKICCECKMPLPPPHRPGERLCARCASGSDKRRVYMEFVFNQGWECRFFESAGAGEERAEQISHRRAEEVFKVRLGCLFLEIDTLERPSPCFPCDCRTPAPQFDMRWKSREGSLCSEYARHIPARVTRGSL